MQLGGRALVDRSALESVQGIDSSFRVKLVAVKLAIGA